MNPLTKRDGSPQEAQKAQEGALLSLLCFLWLFATCRSSSLAQRVDLFFQFTPARSISSPLDGLFVNRNGDFAVAVAFI